MRKLVGALALTAVAATFTACSGSDKAVVKQQVESSKEAETQETAKPTPIDLKNANEVKDVLSYKINEIETTTTLQPSQANGIFNYYKADSGKTLLYAYMDVTNVSQKDITIDDDMVVTFDIDGTTYEAPAVAEKNANLNIHPTVAPSKTERLYFFTNIPETAVKSNIKLNVKVKENASEAEFLLADVKPEKKTLKVGDKITQDNEAEITIKKVQFTKKLEPKTTSGFYTYYEVKDKKKLYVVLTVEAKNLKSDGLEADEVLGMRAVNNGKSYNSISVPEIDGNFESSTLTTIDAKKTVKMHYLAEVPKEAKDGKTEAEIVFAGQKYYISVK